MKGKCPHCGREFGVNPKMITPTHDYPPPCRQVCPGAGKPLVSIGKAERDIAAMEAVNDREIAAGVEWWEGLSANVKSTFTEELNDATNGADLRDFSDKFLANVRHLAMIGLCNVICAHTRKHGE